MSAELSVAFSLQWTRYHDLVVPSHVLSFVESVEATGLWCDTRIVQAGLSETLVLTSLLAEHGQSRSFSDLRALLLSMQQGSEMRVTPQAGCAVRLQQVGGVAVIVWPDGLPITVSTDEVLVLDAGGTGLVYDVFVAGTEQ